MGAEERASVEVEGARCAPRVPWRGRPERRALTAGAEAGVCW